MEDEDPMTRALRADALILELKRAGLSGLGPALKMPLILRELPVQLEVGGDDDYALLVIDEDTDGEHPRFIATLEANGSVQQVAACSEPDEGTVDREVRDKMCSFKVEASLHQRLIMAGGNRSEILRRALVRELDAMGVQKVA